MRKAGRCKSCPAPHVLPENEPIVNAYYTCSTQWRVGMAGRTGLDYPACEIAIAAHRERLQLPEWADVLPGLQTIEHAMLNADGEMRTRERERQERERSTQ